MEIKEVIIPAWAVALLIPAFAGIVWWLVYLTRLGHENERNIAVNTANDHSAQDAIKELKNEMVTRTDRITDKVDKLFELFYQVTKK